jgi:hypothetical protein
MATVKKVKKGTATKAVPKSKAAESVSVKNKGALAKKVPAKKVPPAKKVGKAKRKEFVFEAPADFKPFFLEVTLKTEKDGLLGNQIKAIRYQGRYDPQAEDKKKFDLSAFDVKTLVGLQARIAQVLFKSNPTKFYPQSIKERTAKEKVKKEDGTVREKAVFGAAFRLPPNTVFRIVFRIGKRKADNALTVRTTQVSQVVTINSVKKLKALDRTDPVFKAFGKARRFMAAAFKDVLLPPKRTRSRRRVIVVKTQHLVDTL